MREVEIRLRLSADRAELIPALLGELGFQFIGSRRQTDVTFDRPDGSLFNSGCKIRIRLEEGKMEMTYKDSMRDRFDVSDRTETTINISPEQFDSCKRFLEALDYPELFRVSKERRSWKRGSVTATIDIWPIIGSILELEGPEVELTKLSMSFGSSYKFANYRLRDFFDQVQSETHKTLAQLQKEYEDKNDVSLGRLDLLIS